MDDTVFSRKMDGCVWWTENIQIFSTLKIDRLWSINRSIVRLIVFIDQRNEKFLHIFQYSRSQNKKKLPQNKINDGHTVMMMVIVVVIIIVVMVVTYTKITYHRDFSIFFVVVVVVDQNLMMIETSKPWEVPLRFVYFGGGWWWWWIFLEFTFLFFSFASSFIQMKQTNKKNKIDTQIIDGFPKTIKFNHVFCVVLKKLSIPHSSFVFVCKCGKQKNSSKKNNSSCNFNYQSRILQLKNSFFFKWENESN